MPSTPPSPLLPALPDVPTLAEWLGFDDETLGWLADGGARRRHLPLAQQHYTFQLLPKRSGGHRLIESPRLRLKAVQRRLLAGLLKHIPTHDACHGFVHGRSVLSHAAAHVCQPMVLRFDLQDFFGSVGEARIKAIFVTMGYPAGVADALAGLCVMRTPEPVLQRLLEDRSIDLEHARRLRSAHLPQGAPSSPMLANLSAFRLDVRLAALARSLGASYTRYADDLVLSGASSLQGTRIEARIGAIAIEQGFRLNHRKTSHAVASRRQCVAGIVVNRGLNAPRVEFDRLRAVLHNCALHGPHAQNLERLPDFQAHLRGRAAWMTQLNPARGARLTQLWNRIDWSPESPPPAPTIA
jgi:RNA-directed DNA polymerase